MDQQAEILRSGNHAPESLDLLIQVLVIESADNPLPHHLVKRGGIPGAARPGFPRPAHTHFEHIIVPVSKRVIALPIKTPVFVLRQAWGVQPMRSRELVPPRDAYQRVSPK